MKIPNTEEIKRRILEKFGEQYDLSELVYVDSLTPFKIKCRKHGDKYVFIRNLKDGFLCKDCEKEYNINKNKLNFIRKAQEIHKNEDGTPKYDYSKVNYVNQDTKVCIICPIHGEFFVTPNRHLIGKGCTECKKLYSKHIKVYDLKDFFKRNNIKTDNGYARKENNLVFEIDNELYRVPLSKLNNNINLDDYKVKRYCADRYTFIWNAIQKHGYKYDYREVGDIKRNKKIRIICPVHGLFLQTYQQHINKTRRNGCYLCYCTKQKTTDEFIKEGKEIHKDENGKPKYDYSKVEYINAYKKVCIICPIHGEFWQSPHNHLKGYGCYKCRESKMERKLIDFFNENNIKFERNKKFEWLICKELMTLDFYLPKYNAAIECQGEQHFERYGFEDNDDRLNETKYRDLLKYRQCKENNLALYYFSFDIKRTKMFEENIYNDINVLLNKIKEDYVKESN